MNCRPVYALLVFVGFATAAVGCSDSTPYTTKDSMELRRTNKNPAFSSCLDSFDTGTMRIWANRVEKQVGRVEVKNVCACFADEVNGKEPIMIFNEPEMADCTSRYCETRACKRGRDYYDKSVREEGKRTKNIAVDKRLEAERVLGISDGRQWGHISQACRDEMEAHPEKEHPCAQGN